MCCGGWGCVLVDQSRSLAASSSVCQAATHCLLLDCACVVARPTIPNQAGPLGPTSHSTLLNPSHPPTLLTPPQAGKLRIIAEPGRYFAEAFATYATYVNGWRERAGEGGERLFDYYITDGLYGAMNW